MGRETTGERHKAGDERRETTGGRADPLTGTDALDRQVRIALFDAAAATGRVPQAGDIAEAMGRSRDDVLGSLRRLAAARVITLASNHETIWSANPFCAVPSAFRVESGGVNYSGICIWDALGIAAALHRDAVIHAACGDCSAPLRFEIRDDALVESEGVIHFAVPARHWWDNIGFT